MDFMNFIKLIYRKGKESKLFLIDRLEKKKEIFKRRASVPYLQAINDQK